MLMNLKTLPFSQWSINSFSDAFLCLINDVALFRQLFPDMHILSCKLNFGNVFSLPPSVSLGFVYVLVLSFTVYDCLRRIARRTLYDLQCPYFSPEVIVKFTRRVMLMYGGQSKIRNLVASHQALNFFCLLSDVTWKSWERKPIEANFTITSNNV